MENDQVVVIPTEEDLKIESNGCVCTFEGCSRLFQGSSQLQMHLTKHHHGKQLDIRIGSSVYYCPVVNCDRNASKGQPFPRLGQLKQHYQRIHGTKSYSCHKCGKRFSLKDAHGRHVTECGMDFTCETCRDVFKSRNALYKHARRKGHALPEGSKPKTRKQPPPTNTSNPVLPPRPIIIKQVIRLRNLVSSSTQTHPEDMEQRELTPPTVQPTTSSQISSQTESSFEPSFDFMDLATQTESSFDLMDLATQTDSPFEPSFDLIDLATQTLSTQTKSSFDLIDLATQTEPTFEPSFDLMDLATQTLSTQTEPTFEPSFDLMNLATQTNSGYFDNGTQTTQHAVSYSQSCQTTTTQDCQTGLTTPPSASELTEQGIPSQTVHTHSLDSQDFGTQTTLFD